MDWALDNAGLSDRDLDTVFRYEEKPTTVLRMVGKKEPEIWSLKGKDQWDRWIDNECPHIDGSASGLTLILAKRTGEPLFGNNKKVRSNDWLDQINTELPGRPSTQRTLNVTSLCEKTQSMGPDLGNASGRRSVRTLPFSKEVFQYITTKFYTHRSIARDISRADIPVFSCAEVQMGGCNKHSYPAYVYNCRTTNAWAMDLALTVTYFPHCRMSFAILFGCPLSIEEAIVKRLHSAAVEASHPLLMPGIMAEIERMRHVHVVETTIDEMETKIFELDLHSNNGATLKSGAERRNQEKRTAWLDTTYLRNSLMSWNAQLGKMNDHEDELKSSHFSLSSLPLTVPQNEDTLEGNNSDIPFKRVKIRLLKMTAGDEYDEHPMRKINYEEGQEFQGSVEQHDLQAINTHMRRVGRKIKDRIKAIRDEYDEKIRDCTMRIDGMAMATQWSHGETNVEIALATGRESKHMRSIALVTMVFLPGTFFASVFSMTFFNWDGTKGSVVSGFIWIYVLVTVVFTFLTVGTWWYLVIHRPSRLRRIMSEDDALLDS